MSAPPEQPVIITTRDWVIAGVVLLVVVSLALWAVVSLSRAIFGDDEPEYVDDDSGVSVYEEDYSEPLEPAGPARPGTGKYSEEECMAFYADILDDSKSEWDRSDSVGKWSVHCGG